MGETGKSLRSPLGRARGLGSAKEGVNHWWAQRMTALALIPLGLWLVASLVCLAGADYAAVTAWLAAPTSVGAISLTILAVVYHAILGMQVVIEDYIHTPATKLVLMVGLQLGGFAIATAAIVSLLVIAFAG